MQRRIEAKKIPYQITYAAISNHEEDARITPNRFQSYPDFQRGFGAGGSLMGQAALVLGGYGFAVYQDSFDPRVEVDTAEEQESLLEDFFRTLGFGAGGVRAGLSR